MFTTIEKLRASSAMPSRVNVLQSFMQKTVPGFTDKTPIPIYRILESNGAADASWVANNDQVTQLEIGDLKVAASGPKSRIAARIDSILDGSGNNQARIVQIKSEIYGEIAAEPIPKKATPKKAAVKKAPVKAVAPAPAPTPFTVTNAVRDAMAKFKAYGKVHVKINKGKMKNEGTATIAIYITVPESHELVSVASK